MLQRLDLRGLTEATGADRNRTLRAQLPRNAEREAAPVEDVRAIIADVRARGDQALAEITERTDGVRLEHLRVPQVEVEAALRDLDPLLREALEEIAEAVLAYHRSVRPEDSVFEREGIDVRSSWRPVDRAGCYVPGGRAQYPSSVLMTAIPARVAGVDSVAICVPPNDEGVVPPAVLAAAALAQVDEVFCVGGAQAIAALAYGTETIAPVDVIAGSGNRYVTTAKREVSGEVGVPVSYSGPSEIVVVADSTTPPELAAIDIVAQAEHGPDGSAYLVTWSEETANAVDESLTTLVARASRREHVEATLAANGYAVLVDDAQAAIDVVNVLAPENVEVATVDPEALIPRIRNAAEVFAGVSTPSVIGDYVAGPSHVMPVGGAARHAGALGVRDFMRHQHVVSATDAGLLRVTPHVAALAEVEGLEAHARAMRMRTQP